ncbi:hypothetical protein EOW77_0003550 [Bradyrhizobium yuanmingense]|uniref:hypothetical protein n=1 Tax=Bradyrhizobium yuanmingense TaxID=108015 RepID=UPI000FE3C80A|nr:hypothetical protein [Bradyrhizobium yuanmingense]TGN90920.1 hypothetical protein EOW77_0003550 [Bradyrhizobium yuanmingense]
MAAQTGRKVKEYRAYIVDKDGHVTGRIDLICEDEDVARERAQQLVDGHAVELWQGTQKIDRFDPPPRPSSN